MNNTFVREIAWTLIKTLETSCVLDTINTAKATRNISQPLIIHSDRGGQYVLSKYLKATNKKQTSYSKKLIHGISFFGSSIFRVDNHTD